ncbi:hypothetical protein HanXRQr2_Chr16g0727841 [Helianthus annuus]|uniref:Uncharacterized protein n=1 Tax=Helianthus annuus TaxID=4232 RepID=A0A9K3DMH5_HELAN|nr:hypothetical protein HanXRQr2_Chr16g0727841 [Helianthus annuus]
MILDVSYILEVGKIFTFHTRTRNKFVSFFHTILLSNLKKKFHVGHKSWVSTSNFIHPIVTIHLKCITKQKKIDLN